MHTAERYIHTYMTYRVFFKYFVFFQEFSKPLPRQHWTATGCTENGQPIGVTVHSENELVFYMQGTSCSELKKNTIFNINKNKIIK